MDKSTGAARPDIMLKRGADKRVRGGHLWIYGNEINASAEELKAMAPGSIVRFLSADQRVLGTGYVNPHSLIMGRLLSRGDDDNLAGLLVHRLKVALSLRESEFTQPYYRLVFGEADGLPGLIVDRFGDVLVGQINTAGMDGLRPEIEAALQRVIEPSALLWRNDARVRELEGLPREVITAFGDVPERLSVCEGQAELFTSAAQGQKTGYFFDQMANRDRCLRDLDGKRVLDLYSYVGAWGLRAALAGAAQVDAVDSSEWALEQAAAAAEHNGVADRWLGHHGDVGDFLRTARSEKERWDMVIVDPPAFVKRRKDLPAGSRAYEKVFEQAMSVLAKDGRLVVCSCSSHFDLAALDHSLLRAARRLGFDIQLLAPLSQGSDHPIHPAIVETNYLKGRLVRVMRT